MSRILVIRFSAMGDVAMSVPVIKTALKDHSNLEITVVTHSFLTAIFDGTERLYPVGADLKGRHRGIRGMFRLFRELSSSGKYDAVIDLHDVLRSRILCSFFRFTQSKIYRINKDRKGKQQMLRSKVLRPLPHSTERYKSVFRQAGYPVHSEFDAFPYVHIPSDVIDNLAPLIQRLHRPLIGFAPFAKHPAKTLPIDQSESLIDLLANKFEILLLGGKSDEVHFSKWVDCHDHVHSLAHFNLQEQLAIMLKMQAVISMDSANMHLAAIQGTPVLSIWGGTHPYFGFYGIGSTEKNWVLAEPAVACSPCSVFGNRPCSNKSAPFTCFKQINTEKIVNRLEKILDRQIKE